MWVTRIGNIWSDLLLGTNEKVLRTFVALSFLVAAAVVSAVASQTGSRPPTRGERTAVAVVAAWTTVVWVVRGAGIALADHSVGFVLVHLVLAVVSIGLAALMWRVVERTSGSRVREHAEYAP